MDDLNTERIPKLQTERLILKQVSFDDIESYRKHFVDYEIIRHLAAAVPWPYPEDGIEQFFNSILPQQGKERWSWGLFLKENPTELIGVIELWRKGTPENRGFWLGKKFWGQGIMTEAVYSVMDFAFNQLGFKKLVFANALGNKRSRRIKEKTGAKLIGSEPAKFVDPNLTQHEIWELTKEDWENFKNP